MGKNKARAPYTILWPFCRLGIYLYLAKARLFTTYRSGRGSHGAAGIPLSLRDGVGETVESVAQLALWKQPPSVGRRLFAHAPLRRVHHIDRDIYREIESESGNGGARAATVYFFAFYSYIRWPRTACVYILYFRRCAAPGQGRDHSLQVVCWRDRCCARSCVHGADANVMSILRTIINNKSKKKLCMIPDTALLIQYYY